MVFKLFGNRKNFLTAKIGNLDYYSRREYDEISDHMIPMGYISTPLISQKKQI
jgi:hypothetical protein